MCIFFADILVNGVAALAVGLVVYLGWLNFQQKRERRTKQEARKRQRRGHWGYE
jgi:membrane protein implicated in regulation of membrane protease activity